MHRLDVDTVGLAQPRRQGEGPRLVDLRPERRVDREAPVTELVAEPLDQDRAVVRQGAGRLPLLGEVGEQVRRGARVEPGGGQPLLGVLGAEGADLAQERSERAAQFDRASGGVAVPVGHAPRLAGSRGDEHPVVGDVLDAPGARSQQEDVADPRLVDHLLVELAHPGLLLTDEEHPEHAAVGDGAAAGDGQTLCAGSAGERAGDAVPGDAGPQLGEVVARVAAGQHVEHRLERGLGEPGERSCPS